MQGPEYVENNESPKSKKKKERKLNRRSCCCGCCMLLAVNLCTLAAFPLFSKWKYSRMIDGIRGLLKVESTAPETDFIVEGDRVELKLPEEYGKMYYSQPAVEHYAAAGNGEAYVDNEILAVAKSGVTREAVLVAAGHIGAEIVGEITVTGDYQLRLKESLPYDELTALCQKLCKDPAITDAYPDWLNVTAPDDVPYYQHGVDGFSYGLKVQDDAATFSVDADDYPLYDMKGISWDKEMINCYRAWKYVQSVPVSPVRVGVIDDYFEDNHDNVHFAQIFGLSEDTPHGKGHGMHVAGILAGNNHTGVTGVYPYGSKGYLYGYANADFLLSEHDSSEEGWHMYSANMAWLMSVATLVVQNVKVINISQGLAWDSDPEKYPDTFDRIKHRLKEMGVKNIPGDINEAVKVLFSNAANFDPWVQEAQKVGAFYQRLLDAGYDFLLVTSAGNLGGLDTSEADGLTTLNYPRPSVMPYESRYNSTLNMISETEYPDVYQRILVVGAVEPRPGVPEEKGTVPMVAGYSNAGVRLDLFAPGGMAITPKVENDAFYNAAYGKMIYSSVLNNHYGYKSGTSMAAPEAAGAAALVWSVNPDLTGAQVKELLCDTAQYSCIYNNNEVGYDGLIGKVNHSSNYRLLDVEKAVRKASEAAGAGGSGEMEYGAFTGRVQWLEPKKHFWQKEKYSYLEDASIVAVCREGDDTGKRYTAQTGSAGTFCVTVPPGEYSVRYGVYVDGKYKGKETSSFTVSAEQTIDLGTLTLSAEDDAADIIAVNTVLKNEKGKKKDAADEKEVSTGSEPEIFTDHLDEFMDAVDSDETPNAWMRFRGHIYAIYDEPCSGNSKWWGVLFKQNPYPVAIETADEQRALEQLMVYGEKEAYITGCEITKFDTPDLYWAIHDKLTGYTHFADGHGLKNEHRTNNYVSLYRGSGPEDPEYGLWKVHHESLSTFLPSNYLKDYGYILEWKTEK